MAVVQISRIQNRRGRKNSQTGFPQLASGELGWAIDTQELYIGNGAVSEGAPAVGNTKILTEHDDILNYVTSYTYAVNNTAIQTGLPNFPVQRTLQDRLDDFVSVRSFGAVGNGIVDDTVAIQTAIDQLFINTATKANINSRVVLYFEAGEYAVSNSLKIPPYAHLIGAGKDSTVIKYRGVNLSGVLQTVSTTTTITGLNSVSNLRTGMILSKLSGTGNFGGYTTITSIDTVNKQITISSTTANTIGSLTFTAIDNQPIMRFVDGNSEPGDYTSFGSMSYLQRPRNINIEGMTLSKLYYPSGNSVGQKYTTANGTVYNWDGNSWLVYSNSLFEDTPILYLDNADSSIFNCVKFEGLYRNGYSPLVNQSGVIIRSVSGVFHTENVLFEHCSFENTGYGIYSDCDHNNVIVDNCKFYQVYDALNLGGNNSGNFVVNTNATASDGSTDRLTVGSSQGMFVGMPISFAGSVSFGGIVLKTIYYVSDIIDSTTIKISQTLGGNTFNLTTDTGLIYLISTNAIGASNTKVISSYFDFVERYGIWIKLGTGNTSTNNKYMNVGNLNEGYSNATYPIIKFDTDNNQSVGDYFERNTKLKDYTLYGLVAFIPCVSGSGVITDDTNFRKVLYNPTTIGTAVPQPFFRLPVIDSSNFVIDYTINKTTSGVAIRTGRMYITVDLVNLLTDIKDEFSYTGSSTVENVEFSLELHDYQGNGNYTLLVLLNNTVNNGTGTVTYSYRSLSI